MQQRQIVSVNMFEQVPLGELLATEPGNAEQKVSESESQNVLLFKDL
jgi:hypothetical protein